METNEKPTFKRDIPLLWKIEGGNESRDYTVSMFGVNFFRAIDTYSLNTRAVKYAILFLIVPFLSSVRRNCNDDPLLALAVVFVEQKLV